MVMKLKNMIGSLLTGMSMLYLSCGPVPKEIEQEPAEQAVCQEEKNHCDAIDDMINSYLSIEPDAVFEAYQITGEVCDSAKKLAELYSTLGEKEFDKKDYEKAAEFFEYATKCNPLDLLLHRDYMVTNLMVDANKVIDHFENIPEGLLKDDNASAHVYHAMAVAHAKKDELCCALFYSNRALDISPKEKVFRMYNRIFTNNFKSYLKDNNPSVLEITPVALAEMECKCDENKTARIPVP